MATIREDNFKSKTGRHEIEALLSLISSSARDAMNEYESTGKGVPHVGSSELHELDSVYDILPLKRAIGILEGACQRLCTTLAPPAHVIGNRMAMSFEPACLRVSVRACIADILSEFPSGMHINELSLRTCIDAEKLSRTLRLLVLKGCFREVSTNVFANNRLSLTLLSSNPISASVRLFTEGLNRGVANFYETLTDPEFAYSHEPSKAPFMYDFKETTEHSDMWEVLKSQPKSRESFNRAMMGWSNITGAISALRCPVWSDLPNHASICDVGSGIGGFTIRLARQYPSLKLTLCDLPPVMAQAQTFWNADYPEAVQQKRVDFIPINFFEKIIGGYDVYYMRHIIHDWQDPQAVMILSNIRKVMTTGTRLLVQEYILPQLVEDAANRSVLNLSNPVYQPGSSKLYNLDLMMLVALNAKERALNEYVNLGVMAGLRLEKHWEFAETSLLEFRIMDPKSQISAL
ncbi:S-adenosyl-L-methionine-dependent methyltransferase [Crucibulum laeve]|uniref:S-adenosyl-L-methionine-dependent methyltransferase n=1 Tax=Crucibulum laeve TaxID=68775 RepID=A0A5C3LG81_9AGAR|nr:S-adenosyl-L-methionine-dependent methyltransferase [Crucibulum laeve]